MDDTDDMDVRCCNCEGRFVEETDLVMCRVDEQDAPVDSGGEIVKGCPNCLTDGYLTDINN